MHDLSACKKKVWLRRRTERKRDKYIARPETWDSSPVGIEEVEGYICCYMSSRECYQTSFKTAGLLRQGTSKNSTTWNTRFANGLDLRLGRQYRVYMRCLLALRSSNTLPVLWLKNLVPRDDWVITFFSVCVISSLESFNPCLEQSSNSWYSRLIFRVRISRLFCIKLSAKGGATRLRPMGLNLQPLNSA